MSQRELSAEEVAVDQLDYASMFPEAWPCPTLTIWARGFRAYTVPGEILAIGLKQDARETEPVGGEWRRWEPVPRSKRTEVEGRMRGRSYDTSRSFEAFRKRIAGAFRFKLTSDDGSEAIGQARKGDVVTLKSDLDHVLRWTAMFWLKEEAPPAAGMDDSGESSEKQRRGDPWWKYRYE